MGFRGVAVLMKSRVLPISLCGALLVAGCQPSDEELAARYEGVVRSYCLECHDSAGREAGLSLEDVDLDNVAAHTTVFENVARKLRGRQMPPSGGPRPDAETTTASWRTSSAAWTRPRWLRRSPARRRCIG